jgi:hypothetical protein
MSLPTYIFLLGSLFSGIEFLALVSTETNRLVYCIHFKICITFYTTTKLECVVVTLRLYVL